MMLAGFFFSLLLLLTAVAHEDGNSSNRSCGYRDVLNHLRLQNSARFPLMRPVRDHRSTLRVKLDLLLYAILEVNEKEQKFTSYVWIDVQWTDEYIHWNSTRFCGIKDLILPTNILWKPDLTIEEMTENDKASLSPYLSVHYNGYIALRNDMMVISTCRMHLYKFPFDIQSCNLSFKSVIHNAEEITFIPYAGSSYTTAWSRHMIRSQSEWNFINMEICNVTHDNFGIKQSLLIYTINMKRQSLLYVVNFMLPVLLFLCLDLASFLISDSGGEKLSFKVTVLLAVTVMQLILSEILPSSSDRIPLIAIFCCGSFGLMMISLLETILVMHLNKRDSEDNHVLGEEGGDKWDQVCSSFKGMKRFAPCDSSSGEAPSELPLMAKEESSSKVLEKLHDSESLSDELREAMKTLAALVQEDKPKPGFYSRLAKTINKVFFVLYLTGSIVLLCVLFYNWTN